MTAWEWSGKNAEIISNALMNYTKPEPPRVTKCILCKQRIDGGAYCDRCRLAVKHEREFGR